MSSALRLADIRPRINSLISFQLKLDKLEIISTPKPFFTIEHLGVVRRLVKFKTLKKFDRFNI